MKINAKKLFILEDWAELLSFLNFTVCAFIIILLAIVKKFSYVVLLSY